MSFSIYRAAGICIIYTILPIQGTLNIDLCWCGGVDEDSKMINNSENILLHGYKNRYYCSECTNFETFIFQLFDASTDCIKPRSHTTKVGKHYFNTGHNVSTTNTKVLDREQDWHRRRIKEAIHIGRRLRP